MKVNGTQEIGPRTPVNARVASSGSSSSPDELQATDTVQSSISDVTASARSEAASNRDVQVESIASQVKQGTYVWPTSQQIADRILDDAMLTARLQAMFKS
jgi:anti-sigma28 factor (negative regulator of flagellin synthesis)